MKVYKVRWSCKTKTILAGFLLSVFLAGGAIGYGIASAVHACELPDEPIEETPPESSVVVEPTPEPTPIPTPAVFYYDVPLSHDLQDYIRELCEENGLPMSLVIAMIEHESIFRADVVSKTNDYGLMQINKCNHAWLTEEYGITDFLDPYQNVLCGISMISQYFSRYSGNIHKALMAYNMGLGGASKQWKAGRYTSAYSRKIVERMNHYEQL